MLNPFPIQYLAILAYAILRVITGSVLVWLGVKQLAKREVLAERFTAVGFPFGNFLAWYVGFFEVLIGTLFILGLATQIAALLSMLLSLKLMYLSPRLSTPLVPQKLFWVLLFGASLSLFITGAGAFAFDLPL